MLGQKNPEVLVVGAGPAGLLTAIALAKRDVNFQIIDQEWRPAAHSYALALHPSTLDILEELDLIDVVLERAKLIHTIGFYEGPERQAEIRLSELNTKYPFVAALRQNVLESLMEDALEQMGIRVQWNHQASVLRPRSDHVDLTVDRLEKESTGYPIARTEWVVSKTFDYKVPFVIGADGYKSDVRKAAGIEFPSVGEAQHFAVFEFETDTDLGDEMRIVLDEQSTNVVWMLQDNYCRWSFELEDFDVTPASRVKDRFIVQLGDAAFPVIATEELKQLLTERAPWFRGHVDEIHWRISVRFERRMADQFGKDRMWLVGDAGHMTGPVGVQSMNVGLREAYELAGIVADIIQEGGSTRQLEEYNRHRTAEWRFLLGMGEKLEPTEETDPWVRTRADRILPCIPASGDHLAALLNQLKLKTP